MKPGEHMTIVGRTGSGKSFKALEVVKQFHTDYPEIGIVIINPKKKATDWDKYIPPFKGDKIPKWKKGAFINWKVKPWQEYELDLFLWSIYDKGLPCLIVFDEGQEIKSHKFPSADSLWRQGRELKIGILTCTQRPVDLSRYAISQASYLEVFNIIGEDDLKALDSYMEIPLRSFISPSKIKANGEVIEGKKLKEFHSLFYSVKKGSAEILPPIEQTDVEPFVQPKPPLPWKPMLLGSGFFILLMRML